MYSGRLTLAWLPVLLLGLAALGCEPYGVVNGTGTTGRTKGKKPPPFVPKTRIGSGQLAQIIKAEKIVPPSAAAGIALEESGLPVVVLVLKANGDLDHQPILYRPVPGSARQPLMPPFIPKIEDPDLPPSKPKKGGPKKGGPKKGGPKKGDPKKGAEIKDVATGAPTRIKLSRQGAQVNVSVETAITRMRPAGAVKRPSLTSVLKRTQSVAATQQIRDYLTIEADARVSIQDILTAWEAGRAAGYKYPLFVGDTRNRSDENRKRWADYIDTMRKWLKWPRTGPAYDGELLFLVNSTTRWETIEDLMLACIQARIPRIGFVCRNGTRLSKIRTYLPMH